MTENSVNNDFDLKSTVTRRSEILRFLQTDGQVNVQKLSGVFGVSEVTIRNDLMRLEHKSMLIRTHGGALRPERVGVDFAIAEKQKLNFQQKQSIGQKAASLVQSGETIILDSGTTTLAIAKNLGKIENLTVITNALNIAGQLAEFKNIKVIMPGGILRTQSYSLVGAPAEEGFRNIYCDRLFIGVDGIDSEYGLSTPNIEEAHLNRVMIAVSREVIVVSDSSKFLRRSFAFIAPMSKVHTIITDSGIPETEKKRLENIGVNILIV